MLEPLSYTACYYFHEIEQKKNISFSGAEGLDDGHLPTSQLHPQISEQSGPQL